MTYTLVHVDRFPADIESGKLYWSIEYGMSAHRCACGCGDVIYLPIGAMDYSLFAGASGPTLRPSVGNWNVCDAHYFITNGEVKWAPKWTQSQISVGRNAEDSRRAAYYDTPSFPSFVQRIVALGRRLLKGIRD